jgi:hypothetical protein
MDNIPDDLLKLKLRFDQWRANRKSRSEPIPDDLRRSGFLPRCSIGF